LFGWISRHHIYSLLKLRTNEQSLFVNEIVENGWLPVDAKADQSCQPKKQQQKHNKKHIRPKIEQI